MKNGFKVIDVEMMKFVINCSPSSQPLFAGVSGGVLGLCLMTAD